MTAHRPAAELAAEIVNAWKSHFLDHDWVAALLARESLPIRHRGVAAPKPLVANLACVDYHPSDGSPNKSRSTCQRSAGSESMSQLRRESATMTREPSLGFADLSRDFGREVDQAGPRIGFGNSLRGRAG
ncbi:putative phosphatidylserine decarboxylase [Rhodococcus sp. AW25M09]|uniref:hypothetical protein n=1 Tax=Rhodococcus sp. AW25M09 TaxID=1268303 RepID=UPI0002AD0F4C|nr:hypothetical protein [Rhodococcus sp. AW25M09]CCQ14948.1 putative phosphatidylserine decarboxylase [Rhodococcus sp. AW25M09]